MANLALWPRMRAGMWIARLPLVLAIVAVVVSLSFPSRWYIRQGVRYAEAIGSEDPLRWAIPGHIGYGLTAKGSWW